MSHQRCPEGYAVVVHSRAEAYPLQGWFERRQRPPSSTPPLSGGPAAPDPVKHVSVYHIFTMSSTERVLGVLL